MPKRKSLSSSMDGTLTSSRSEIFVHRTRSGHARPDPKSCAAATSSPAINSFTAVKDLRTKRIFSDQTEKTNLGSDLADLSKNALIDPNDDPLAAEMDGDLSADRMEEKTLDLDPDSSNMQQSNLRMNKVSDNSEEGMPAGFGLKRGTEAERMEKNLGMQSTNLSRTRWGLSPCSQLKVNGNQRSFSYKRLLPYLKDIYKDESSDRKILHSNNLSIRVENTTENRLSFLSAEDLSHMVALENSSIAVTGENQGFEENFNLKCEVDILQTTTIESPDLYCQRKLNVQQIIGKMGTNDKGMAGINRLEEETSDFKEHYRENSQDVLQITTVQSPDTYSGRKLQVHEPTKMDTDANGIIHINAIETEETSEKIDGSNTEITIGCDDDSIQGTPPDADLVNKFDDATWKRSSISGQEACNTSRKRPEPSSCSRLKLFQNLSNSFSYKRLLPYIMDLVKDGSSGMEILDRKNYTTKKVIEERSLLSNNDPSPSEQQHTIPLGDSSTVTSIVNQHSDEKCVSKRHGLCSDDVDNPVTMVSPISCNKGRLEAIEYKSELPIQKSDYEIEMLCEPSYCSSTIREDLSVQELAGNTQKLSNSSIKMDRKPLHGVPQIGGKRALPPRKGILKKQARGCRGICTCLDCASFRVHAERAFEFSRKQMVEADDVAERLLKELSCLRNLVERFVEPILDSTGTCTSLQLNQEQVQGVCQRALRVEEAAKGRMREMILDLNTHCRIPGPRVTFSEYIEKQEYHIAGYQKGSS